MTPTSLNAASIATLLSANMSREQETVKTATCARTVWMPENN